MLAMGLKRTALYEEHVKRGAKLVDFAGWEMPVSYRGILDEVRAVRTAAGLFDVSHMGTVFVSGPRAAAMLDSLVPSDIGGLERLQARYSMLLNAEGGALDDLIIYRLGPERFLVIVNASRRENDVEHMLAHAGEGVSLVDETLSSGILALQGPRAEAILQTISSVKLGEVKSFHAIEGEVAGRESLIARTGYTGEDGFEIMTSAESAPVIWRALFEAGESQGLLAAGLGARDVLRLEAGLPLYGHELDERTNPYEIGFGWIVKLDKGEFLGREALVRVREEGVRRRLRGLEVLAKAIPRAEQLVFAGDRQVGIVTSGTFSPTLNKPIAMAFLEPGVGEEAEIEIRDRRFPARVVPLPFYRRPKPG